MRAAGAAAVAALRFVRSEQRPGADVNLIEKVFAGAMLAVCLLLMLRLVLGPSRRFRFDAALRRFGAAVERRLQSLGPHRSAASRAEREADKAIERARRRAASPGEWDGNVYRPKSFKRKKRDLH